MVHDLRLPNTGDVCPDRRVGLSGGGADRGAVGLGALTNERVELFPGPDALELADTTRGSVFTRKSLCNLR